MDAAGTRRLALMRHAKSAWDDAGAGDAERALAPRGRRDAPRAGAWLAARGAAPELVLCSTARRARETLALALPELGAVGEVRHEARLYLASRATLLDVLAEAPPSTRCALLVGHDPGLTDLLAYLSGGAGVPGRGKPFPTGAVALLELPADWRALPRGCGALLDGFRPRER